MHIGVLISTHQAESLADVVAQIRRAADERAATLEFLGGLARR